MYYRQRSKSSLDDSIEGPSGFNSLYVWSLVAIANLGMICYGYSLAVLNSLSFYLPDYVFQWPKEDIPFYQGLSNSLLAAGAAAGSVLAGSASKSLGRKTMMVYADLIALVGVLLTWVAITNVFFIGRTCVGFAIGINCVVVPLYVSEMAPRSMQGSAGSFIQLMIALSIILSLALGFGISNDQQNQWWRVMLGIPLITIFLRLFFFIIVFKYETPRYYVSQEKHNYATKVLKRIYKGYDADVQLMSLRSQREMELSKGSIKYKELLGKQWRWRFAIGCYVAFLQQMTGFNGLLLYSSKIFYDEIGDEQKSLASTLVMMTCQLVGTFLSGFLMKKTGRKVILIAGCVLLAGCWITFWSLKFVGVTTDLTYPIYAFSFLYGLTIGPISWVFIMEVIPTNGVGLALLVNWIGGFLIAQCFPLLISYFPRYGYLLFPGFLLFSIIICSIYVKETKNVSEEEIAELYQRDSDLNRLKKLSDVLPSRRNLLHDSF